MRSIVEGSTALIQSAETPYSPFARHTSKTVVAGDSIKISIGNELLIDVTDADHAGGFIGVRTAQGSVSLDNVSVVQPAGC
ncbi:MAG: hypothetical protein P8M21_01500 [Halioglobus sp.]|nr:hypothetical protein [Halioglobus sp.]